MSRIKSGLGGTTRPIGPSKRGLRRLVGGLIAPQTHNVLAFRLAACSLLAILVVACGALPAARSGAQASPSAASSLQSASPRPGPTVISGSGQISPTPSASPLVTPSPPGHLPVVASTLGGHLAISCTGTIGDNDPVAIAFLHGQTYQVLRDYSDPAHPRSVCTFGLNVLPMEILDPHHVVVQAADLSGRYVIAVVELPSVTAYQLNVPVELAAVAPDWSQVLWFTSDFTTLHDSSDTSDVVIQRYPPPIGGRCGNADTDSRNGAFSRSSSYGYALQGVDIGHEYLNVVAGRSTVFAEAPPTGGWGPLFGPLMAVWSPLSDTLYYRKQGDLWRWTPTAGSVKFKAGINWIDPSVSPDGKYIVYTVRGSNGTPTVHLMDAATGNVLSQLGAGSRDVPFFLTNDLIWLHGDLSGCTGSVPTNYIYDLRDHTESPSVIDWVQATWPATSALGG